MVLHFLSDAATTAHENEVLVLGGKEAHHAGTVRRVRVGESVTVGDGSGVWLSAVVASADPTEVSVRIVARTEHEPPSATVTLAQALAKGGRDELAIQAATELGVDEIVPWQAARSVSRWNGPKQHSGHRRWTAIVREAAKQAHRAWVPPVLEPIGTSDLAERAEGDRMLILDPAAADALSEVELPGDGAIVLVVGPEGGIAPEERAQFESAGAHAVRLGQTVLRTSTAGPAALALLNLRLGRW